MEKTKTNIVVELPEKTLFSRSETAALIGVGLSTLDSLIKETDLPRVRIQKRVYFLRNDIADYIMAHRSTNRSYSC